MFTKILSKDMTLTPKQAERLLALGEFKAQRKPSAPWINHLANVIREDLFTSGHIAVAHFKNGTGDKEKYLINGQHQCNGCIQANKAIPVRYEEYDCGEDMESVSLLYRQFDNFRTRSIQNLTTMEIHSLGLNWPNNIASLVVSGAALKEGMKNAHKNKKVELLREYIKQGNFIVSLLTDIPDNITQATKHLRRSPVIYAILMTWEKSQSDSSIFWTNVRDGEGLRRKQPEFLLREFLKESTYAHGRGATTGARRIITAHEMTSRCITAWNAFRKGSTTTLKYFPNKPIPKPI